MAVVISVKIGVKENERILGDSEFVTALLSEAKEKFERGYKLNALGYDLKKISQIVSRIYDIEIEEIYSKGRCNCPILFHHFALQISLL